MLISRNLKVGIAAASLLLAIGALSKPAKEKHEIKSPEKSMTRRDQLSPTYSAHASSDRAAIPEKFQRYQQIESKILKTESETRAYQDYLSDPELIEASVAALLHPDLNGKPSEIQSVRLDRVNYLVKSLHSSHNERLQRTLAAVEKVILEARSDPSWPETVKRFVVGDRIELFMALEHRFPEKAQELRDQVAGDQSTSRILAYADGFYKSQKAYGVKQ